jgi:Zn-dependent membrane protease YugP
LPFVLLLVFQQQSKPTVLFALVTLLVKFYASRRARELLVSQGILLQREIVEVKAVTSRRLARDHAAALLCHAVEPARRLKIKSD